MRQALYLRHKSNTTISPIHLLLQWKLMWTEYAKNNNVQSYHVWRNGLQPVIIKDEETHLWFSGFQNEITKLFNLKTGLEWQLQLEPFDHNTGKVKQVYLHTQKKTKWQSRLQLISTQHPSNCDPAPGSCCGSLTAYKACICQNLQSYFPLRFNVPYFTQQSQSADRHPLCRPCTFWKYCSTHWSSYWNTGIFSSHMSSQFLQRM